MLIGKGGYTVLSGYSHVWFVYSSIMSNKRKIKDDEYEYDPVPKHLAAPAHIRNQEKRLIIILEKAQLETVKVGCNFPNTYIKCNKRLFYPCVLVSN